MNRKMSMKEALEKSKARRANQEQTNAKNETSCEQDAANDPNVDTAKDQSEDHLYVTKSDAEVQPEASIAKKKSLTMKELLNAKNASKQHRAVALARTAQHREHQDEPIEATEAKAEQSSQQDEDDDEPAEPIEEMDIAETPHRSTGKKAPRPAASTAIAPVQKKPFPVGAFGSLAPVIMLMARAVQVSAEMVASAMIGAISALAQALINVSPKKSGVGCPVTINLLIIALSADRKSSTISAVIKPILAAISRATDCRRHMLIQDVTVDGMVIGLIDRCHSQLLIAPEGASLFGGHAMSPDNLGRFMGNVSSLFSGEALTRTRAKEHSYAEDRRLSLLVFVQPVIAMDFLSSPLVMQQGLGNRFLYSQPQSLVGTRKFDDIELDEEPVYKEYCEKITKLANQQWKINPHTGGVDARTVRLSDDAKAAWVKYYDEMELAIAPGGDMATHAGYAGRYSEQILRLAALLAIADDPNVVTIGEETMLNAIEIGSYYMDSAMSAFNVAPANKDELDAGTLLDWIRSKQEELGIAGIPVRMMYRVGPRCARPQKRTKALLDLLESRGEISKCDKTIVYGSDNKRSNENYAVTGL
ncbi:MULTISPECIES: DUF3987 domain-containing protein [unclassified Massilia]|uniref:DUF3987 domain-containing protein n=1 Tax=unclassified Massilia TaxID=2609279 RepID=UPI00177F81FB|nr:MULTISPECIES: DUF3987 domain-containing protein [unclassified Massilia]MBD8529565.1 DUF3987 domain-containing protein [Massilia sp. CFBP 13647]MBD8673348.1 DUF3987 domain-containing protein [Massilia sp. CFBP 13721]